HDVAVWRDGAAVEGETPLGPARLVVNGTPEALRVEVEGVAATVHLHRAGDSVTLARPGRRLTLIRHRPAAATRAETGGDRVTAPLPGRVQSIAVAPGATIEAGATVAVIEAMKMEHALAAPRAGTIAEVLATPGDQVDEGALIAILEPADDG
ncbi:MAG: biotin/lipoyl-containing protein, partial [Pseudomonadota bacterium]